MKKSGYTIPELVVLMVIVGVVYFAVANKASYAFSVNYEDDLYNQTIASIEESAKIYGENNPSIFDGVEGNSVYMTVDDLAVLNVIFTNSEGVVVDPRHEDKTLNALNVKITKQDDKVTAEVLQG